MKFLKLKNCCTPSSLKTCKNKNLPALLHVGILRMTLFAVIIMGSFTPGSGSRWCGIKKKLNRKINSSRTVCVLPAKMACPLA